MAEHCVVGVVWLPTELLVSRHTRSDGKEGGRKTGETTALPFAQSLTPIPIIGSIGVWARTLCQQGLQILENLPQGG